MFHLNIPFRLWVGNSNWNLPFRIKIQLKLFGLYKLVFWKSKKLITNSTWTTLVSQKLNIFYKHFLNCAYFWSKTFLINSRMNWLEQRLEIFDGNLKKLGWFLELKAAISTFKWRDKWCSLFFTQVFAVQPIINLSVCALDSNCVIL